MQTTTSVELAVKEWIDKNPTFAIKLDESSLIEKLGDFVELRAGVASCVALIQEINPLGQILLRLHITYWNKEQITINHVQSFDYPLQMETTNRWSILSNKVKYKIKLPRNKIIEFIENLWTKII